MIRTSTLVPAMATLFLLAACGGGDQPTPDAASTADVPETAPAAAGAPAPAVASATNGEELFARCTVCHMADGNGMPGAFPPLAGSEWVTGPAARPIAVLLHGLQGEIKVKGTTYNSAMMAYGTGVPMTDDEVAAVVTYVRTHLGNSASAVTASEVAAVRQKTAGRSTPMTQKDLEALQ